jgi:hypothetical protein
MVTIVLRDMEQLFIYTYNIGNSFFNVGWYLETYSK